MIAAAVARLRAYFERRKRLGQIRKLVSCLAVLEPHLDELRRQERQTVFSIAERGRVAQAILTTKVALAHLRELV